jgi:hypothetical protein
MSTGDTARQCLMLPLLGCFGRNDRSIFKKDVFILGWSRITNILRLGPLNGPGRPTEVEVKTYDGRENVRALAFISPPDLLIPEGMSPSDRYSGQKLLALMSHLRVRQPVLPFNSNFTQSCCPLTCSSADC